MYSRAAISPIKGHCTVYSRAAISPNKGHCTVYSRAAISPNKGHCTGLQTLVGAQEPSNSVNTEVELGFHSELDTQSFAVGLTKSFWDTV